MSYTPWQDKGTPDEWVQPTITPGDKPEWENYANLNDWAAIKNVGFAELLDDFSGTVLGSDISPNGTLYAVGDTDGDVIVYNTLTWDVVETLTDAGGSQIASVAFSPDSSLLAVGISAGTLSPELRIYNTSTWAVEEEITTARTTVTGLDFYWGGDTPLLATASTSSSHQLLIYNTDTWGVEENISTSGLGWKVNFSPDGSHLAFSRWDGTVTVYETDTWTVEIVLSDGEGLMECSYSPDGSYLATGSRTDSNVRIYETSEYSLIETLTEPANEVRSLNFSPDSRLLVAGGRGTFSQIYFTETWEVDKSVNAATSIVNTVGFFPDNSGFYIGGSVVSIYDVEQYKETDKVLHVGQVWQSDINDNIDEPPTNWTDIGYKVGDQVAHLGDIWLAQVDDTLEEPVTGSDWLLGVPFYNQNDTVQHIGQQWSSNIDENFSEPPTNWSDFSYQAGDLYKHNEALWRVLQTGTLDEPSLSSDGWEYLFNLLSNKTANNTLLTNKQANNNGIINKTANPTNLNNVTP